MKNVLFLLSLLLFVACSDQKQKAGSSAESDDRTDITADSVTADNGTKADEGVVSIHKQWVSQPDQDGVSHLFDLRDDHHFLEAMTFTEDYCKEIGNGAKPGVFYIITESSDYKVELERPDVPTQGSIDYLMEEGPLKGEYVSRVQFSDLTATKITLLFEGEFEHTFIASDKPVQLEPNPEKK